MILQRDWRFAMSLVIFRMADVRGVSTDLIIVLHEHAIVENRDARRREQSPVFMESRRCIRNVVNIPFAWLAHGIHQRRTLLIDTASLTVDISWIVVTV